MVFAPLEGWRHVKVTDRHTALDYAHVLKELSDTWFPNAKKIALVQDNLNTHKPAKSGKRHQAAILSSRWNATTVARMARICGTMLIRPSRRIVRPKNIHDHAALSAS